MSARPIATERLYRTAAGEVVPEGHPAAAFLLCIPGEEIPEGFDAPGALAIADEPEVSATEADDDVEHKAPPKRTRRTAKPEEG